MRSVAMVAVSVGLLLTVLVPGIGAQAPPSTFEYVLTDPAGDNAAQCTAGPGANPCDILKFEATSTDTEFVFRFTSATLTFPATATPSSVVFRFLFTDPDGKATGVGRQIAAAAESDNPFPVAGGPATTWKLERAKAQLTGTILLEDLEGAEPGAKLTPTGIQTYWTQAGTLYWTNTDTVAGLKPYVFPVRATPENLTGEAAAVNATIGGNATGQLLIQNHGAEPAKVTIQIAGTNAPGFAPSFEPQNGTIEANGTMTLELSVLVPTNATEGTLRWDFFVLGEHGGNATITWELMVQAAADATGEAAGNATPVAASEAAAPGDEGIPGFEALTPALAAALALLGFRRRHG